MRYRILGRTGFQIADVAAGLWGMGGWSGSRDEDSLAALQLAVDLGCNFFDTAWAYGNGRSDSLLGQTLKANPNKRIYSASKVPPKNGKWPARPTDDFSEVFPELHVLKTADSIRHALGVQTIDLLQFHVWVDEWADNEHFRNTVVKLKEKKIVHAFGLSLNRWQPANGIKAIETGLVDSVQVIYNVFDQNPEDELFPVCRGHNIGVIARVPLDEGSLGGKMTRETTFPETDWRAGYFNPKNLNSTMDRVDLLRRDLPEDLPISEAAIRFILSNEVVTTQIIGMRNLEHVRQNISLSDKGQLDAELLEKLKKHRWERKPAPWSD